jgi:rod shape-determining protein MreB
MRNPLRAAISEDAPAARLLEPIVRVPPRATDRLLGALTEGLAIDLGTSRTRIYAPGRGIVLDEPSTIAIDRGRGQLAAVGQFADRLRGREPVDIAVFRPVRGGAIENVDAAEKMLAAFARLASRGRWRRSHLVIGVPGSSTPIEQRAVRNAALDARAVRVDLIDSGLASALGADLGDDDRAHIVVDIGGGTTDIAVVVASYVVVSASVKLGGDKIDDAIKDYARSTHGIVLGDRTAEAIKRAAGSGPKGTSDANVTEIVGKGLGDGFPKSVKVCDGEIHEAIRPILNRIVAATRQVVEKLSPDATVDIYETGLTLTGGGAQLDGIEDHFREALGLSVTVAKEPANAAAVGAGRLLTQPDSLGRVALRESVWLWRSTKGFVSA